MGYPNVAQRGTAPFTHNRWVQLAIGIVCMGLVANLQYAWTLFVVPIIYSYLRTKPPVDHEIKLDDTLNTEWNRA